jgi:catechol 2,3-dioxygenase-like lactoylglutathione lyase family enzyme
MEIQGLVWLGTRTDKFSGMVEFSRDVLGLSPQMEGPDFAACNLPNGDQFEIFGPADQDTTFMTCPVGGFLVDSVERARAEMEAKGVEFVSPIQTWTNGNSWCHFRAPDGHVYEIMSRPR